MKFTNYCQKEIFLIKALKRTKKAYICLEEKPTTFFSSNLSSWTVRIKLPE